MSGGRPRPRRTISSGDVKVTSPFRALEISERFLTTELLNMNGVPHLVQDVENGGHNAKVCDPNFKPKDKPAKKKKAVSQDTENKSQQANVFQQVKLQKVLV